MQEVPPPTKPLRGGAQALEVAREMVLVLEGNRGRAALATVIGRTYIAVYDNQSTTGRNGQFYFLGAGDRLLGFGAAEHVDA